MTEPTKNFDAPVIAAGAAPESAQGWMAQPALQDLLEQSARVGTVSYDRINTLLGDLQIDAEEAEALFEALENRGIHIVESEIDAAPTTAKSAKPAKRIRPLPTMRLPVK